MESAVRNPTPSPSGGSAWSPLVRAPNCDTNFQPEDGIVTVIGGELSKGAGSPDGSKTRNGPSGRPPAAGLGAVEGAASDGASVAVGSGVVTVPGPLGAGPSSRAPTKSATTTAAAPRPIGMSLFMLGALHGPMTTR